MRKHNMHHQQCRVMHDVVLMTIEQLQEQYDIQVEEDGTVWDNCEGKEFATLQDWALYIEEVSAEYEDDAVGVGGKSGKFRYTDDY